MFWTNYASPIPAWLQALVFQSCVARGKVVYFGWSEDPWDVLGALEHWKIHPRARRALNDFKT